VPERRNVVRSYSGFPDATELIVGARFGFERLGVDQEVKEPAQARNEFPNLGKAILTGQNLVRLLSQ
jgi:hypothetical protein